MGAGADRRSKLLQIVFDQIAEKGFEGLRFQEIAAAAGITNATLYYYFPSKEALIQGLVESLLKDLNAKPVSRATGAGTALQELRDLFDDVYRRVSKDPRFFVVITELALRAQRDPAIGKIGKERDRSWESRLRSLLERGVADGSMLRDIDVHATSLALMVQIKGIGQHAAMEKRKPGEIRTIVDEISAQVCSRLAPG